MASVHDKPIGEQPATPPMYPLYIFDNDESSFREFHRPDDLLYFEKPDVLDGLYEGWDSTGRHFDLAWDESTKEPVTEFTCHQDPRQSLARFIETVFKYESECADEGILFSELEKQGYYPGQLCDPKKLHVVIERIESRRNGSM